MEKLRAEKVYSKEFDGKNGKWKKYSVKYQDVWYTLKGDNLASIKDNDELIGEISTKDYTTKDGKEGTEHIFTLIDPLMADILARIERLESNVFPGVVTAKPLNNDDLPF